MKKSHLAAISTIIGAMVGVGLLAMPEAMAKPGFLPSLALLAVLGLSSILITMYTAELSYKVKKVHQLPVLISRFTSPRLRIAVLVFQVLAMYSALIAFLIALGQAVSALLNIPYLAALLVVFALASPFVYGGFKAMADAEMPLSMIKIALIVLVSFLVLATAKPSNLETINLGQALYPFGIMLFAVMSFSVVPEVKEELGNRIDGFNKVVLISYVVSLVAYALFSAAFIGAFGSTVSAIATQSISSGIYGTLFYLITVFLVVTPFIALGLVLVDAFHFDFKIRRTKSFAMAMAIPLVIAATGLNIMYFLELIGGLFLPILSILVLYAVHSSRKERKKSPYVVPGGAYAIIFTAAIMLIGLAYTIIFFFI